MNWAPAQSSALREPGLWRADPYLERYHVAGTSLIVIALNSGDTLTVTDPEGGQVAEVVALTVRDNLTQAHLAPTHTYPQRAFCLCSQTQARHMFSAVLTDAVSSLLLAEPSASSRPIAGRANNANSQWRRTLSVPFARLDDRWPLTTVIRQRR